MSMDLSVWAAQPFQLPTWLPEAKRWTQIGCEWYYEEKEWQISVMTVNAGHNVVLHSEFGRCVTNDTPDAQVVAKLPETPGYVAYITLEPIGGGAKAYRVLEKVVRALAQKSNGVWVRPSDGEAFFSNEGKF